MANKSLFKAFLLLLASSLSFLVLSCSMDLEPAWKKGTTLTIEMGAPTAEQSRALLTQSGFLYIVPGTKILGPYAISDGARFSTTDVNPGTYASFILVYSSYKIDPEILQSALDGDESFIDALTRDVSGRVSYGALRDVTIKPSMDNVVAATLVPAVSSGLIIDPVECCLEVPVNPEEGEISVSRFIKINNPLIAESKESKVVGIEFSINATTTDGGFLPQANLPTDIPVYAGDGKASPTFIRKNYTDGIATYTGPLPAVKDTLYISVSFTPDKNRSAIHVSLVQRIDTTVEPGYTTFMTIGDSLEIYSGKRFFAYVHEKTETSLYDQLPAAFGMAVASGTSVKIGLIDTYTGEPWVPNTGATYEAGFFVDVLGKWPDFSNPDLMSYVNSGQLFYDGMMHGYRKETFLGSVAATGLAGFDCANLVAVKTVEIYDRFDAEGLETSEPAADVSWRMLERWDDNLYHIPMPVLLTGVYGQFKEWNTKADGTGSPYKPRDVYTPGTTPLVLYAIWVPDTEVPSGIFTVSLTGAFDYADCQIAAVLQKVDPDPASKNNPLGFVFGTIATDGSFEGSFTDYVGYPLESLQAGDYSVTLFIDATGQWLTLSYYDLFDFSQGSLFSGRPITYSGADGFAESFTVTDFAWLHTITAWANDGGATPYPVVFSRPGGTIFTLAPTMTPFTRAGYSLAGWSMDSFATIPEYPLGSQITVTSDLELFAVWTVPESVAVSVTITNPDSPVFAFSGPAATVYTVPIEVSVTDETDTDLSNTYAWELNGVDTGVSSSGIMLDFVNGVGKDSYMIGMNTLSLIVGKTVDGVTNYYSDSYSFEVTEPITP